MNTEVQQQRQQNLIFCPSLSASQYTSSLPAHSFPKQKYFKKQVLKGVYFIEKNLSFSQQERLLQIGCSITPIPTFKLQAYLHLLTFLSSCILNESLKCRLLLFSEDQEVSDQPAGRTPHSLGLPYRPWDPLPPTLASMASQQESFLQ